jgi:hypothetical protein
MAEVNLFSFVALAIGLLAVLRRFVPRSGNAAVETPIVGSKSLLFSRYEFYKNARVLLDEGYSKVSRRRLGKKKGGGHDHADTIQFKDRIFKLSNQDILVLPRRYVEEIMRMPEEHVSSIQANIDVNF